MKIVLTGASSFTGAWFAATLARDGHAVTATLQGRADDYAPLAALRIAMMRDAGVALAEGVSHGNDAFFALIGEGCDVLGYHGADVRDYRSPDFDVQRAVAANTAAIGETLDRAKRAGTGRIVYTGTVAEPGEGGGEAAERAMSPYGLSKYLSWEVLHAEARAAGVALGKFVIPNPFGRFEQERYCSYLMACWARGETAQVRTPGYIRDNIPVDRLARAYAGFARLAPGDPGADACRPSGYAGSQADFTARFAREIGSRLALATPYALLAQSDFSEPLTRINRDAAAPGWDEGRFWDDLAAYYAMRFLARR